MIWWRHDRYSDPNAMRLLMRSLAAGAWCVGVTACSTITKDAVEPPSHAFARLADAQVADVIPLTDPSKATMQEIAISFPVFEMTNSGTLSAIKMGGVAIEQNDRRWMLFGDGAQPSVEVLRLSERNDHTLNVALNIGPCFDGFGFRMPKYHYTFVRIANGWQRTGWSVTFHNGHRNQNGNELPPLSEKANRKMIGKTTGKR